jgi:hypothetical protein
MIFTLHYDDNVDERTSKPEIIPFYKQTKGGDDVVDGMSALYTYNVSRPSRRFIFSPLNVGTINAYIILWRGT